MGNSVLDYNVFGRRGGIYAGEFAKNVKQGKLTLEHVNKHEKGLKKAKIDTDLVTPVILPSYTPEDVKLRQLAQSGNSLARHAMLKGKVRHDDGEAHP